MKNMFVQQMKKHMAVAALTLSLAACTMSGCAKEAMEENTTQTAAENATEDTEHHAGQSASDLSVTADMGTVAEEPDKGNAPAQDTSAAEQEETKDEEEAQDTSVSSEGAPAGQDTSASTASGNKDSSTASGSNASAADTKTPSKEQNKAEQAPAQMAQNTQPQPEQAEQTPEALPSVPPVPQPQESQPATEKPKPASCTHNWQAVSHEETVCIQAEWDEKVLVGAEYYCLNCGIGLPSHLSLDGETQALDGEALAHLDADGGRYGGRSLYETIHHDPVYETKTVFDYYECPNCSLILGEKDYNRIYGNAVDTPIQ